jgi:hypothetical protein
MRIIKSQRRAPSAPPSTRGKWSKVAIRDRCAYATHPLIHCVDGSHHCSCGERQMIGPEKPERGECPACDEEQGK